MRSPSPPIAVWILIAFAAGAAALHLLGGWGGRPTVELTYSDTPPPALEAIASYAPAVERASPAVVNVYTSKLVSRRHPIFDDPLFREFFGEQLARPRAERQTSLGSGVIASADGYLLTNHHVVDGADEIEVLLSDGRSARATLVGNDPETDLAVLRIELKALPAITFGDSDALRVGDVTLAIGNPFGVGQTVTQGIVSAKGRSRLGLSTFENFIQTDAAINPGNSGGALVNARGELVGINTAIYSKSGGSQGIGFAIPASLARRVLTQIIEHGRVLRGWLGVEIQDLTPALAESFGLESGRGALIAGVLRGGPAHRGGLRPGDVVTELEGEEMEDATALLNRVAQHPPGARLRISGVREGRGFEMEVEVGERLIEGGR